MDRLADRARQRIDCPFAANKHMVELFQRVNPIFVLGDFGRPHFVDPANACLAVVFPSSNGIDVQKIMVGLTQSQKQIVFFCQLHFSKPRTLEDQPPRNVTIKKTPLPAFFELIAWLGIQTDKINLVDFTENILSFIMAAEKCLLLEVSAGWHADAGLPDFGRLQLIIDSARKSHTLTVG
jgi:hypothetical protein